MLHLEKVERYFVKVAHLRLKQPSTTRPTASLVFFFFGRMDPQNAIE